MTISKRLYLVFGLVAVIALAFSVVTLTSSLTSAGSDAGQTCDQQDEADDAAEGDTEEADTDSIEEECGPQDEADDTSEAEDANDADSDGVQEPALNGSIAVPEGQDEGLSEADEAAALAPLATVSTNQAVAAARAEVPGDLGKVELENENGSLVYSVEIGGKDVKVDAGTGVVLHVESDGPED
ncbi:MAG: PepSY domain-containing protein [Chloroflexi bacterium]|nr:PepSY domain-containing protein [Chloroflexota bacterium]